MPEYTDLEISGITIPDFASRAMTFTFEPIEQSKQMARDVNGKLVDLSLPRFRCRRLVINVPEHEKPVFDDVWPGQIVTVTLIPGLGVGSETDPLTLSMMVMSWDTSHEEWEAQGDWSLELEEVEAVAVTA